MANEGKFSGKATTYDRFRPGYPPALIWYLAGAAGLGDGSVVADIGAGTGIFSRELATTGARVIAVEPNADMLAQARAHIGDAENVELRQAGAEKTGLPDGSVDLVTAAQAFHWFDRDRFRAECARILRPGGRVALVWNSRVPDAPVNLAAEDAMRELCPAFHGFSGGVGNDPAQFTDFFAGQIEHRVFPNDLAYDEDGFVGRNLSASYAPRPGDAGYEEFVRRFREIFRRFSVGGVLTMPNVTRLYLGFVAPMFNGCEIRGTRAGLAGSEAHEGICSNGHATSNGASDAHASTAARIRPMRMDDYDEVRALWLFCPGMGLNDVDDTREGIARLLAKNPTTCLVAEEAGASDSGAADDAETGDTEAGSRSNPQPRICGSILAGTDGRRAYIYHTAVRPDAQRAGIGSALVEAELSAIRALGISKAFLVVFHRNEAGSAFWERMGFTERHDIAYRDRALRDIVRFDT